MSRALYCKNKNCRTEQESPRIQPGKLLRKEWQVFLVLLLFYYYFYYCYSIPLLFPSYGKNPPTGIKTAFSIPASRLERSKTEILKQPVSKSPELNLSFCPSYLFCCTAFQNPHFIRDTKDQIQSYLYRQTIYARCQIVHQNMQYQQHEKPVFSNHISQRLSKFSYTDGEAWKKAAKFYPDPGWEAWSMRS